MTRSSAALVALLASFFAVDTVAFSPQKAFTLRGRDLKTMSRPWWKVWAAPEGDAAAASDITSSKAFLSKKLEVLAKELAKLDTERAEVEAAVEAEEVEWGAPTRTLLAEFKNLQERTFNESRDAELVARVAVVKELLPVVDNLERAKKSISAESVEEVAAKAYYDGQMEKLDEVLKSFGLTPIPAVGEPYDFNVHEAIQQTPSDEYGEEVVCAEFQRGFMIGDKLLRPAVVAVSMGA